MSEIKITVIGNFGENTLHLGGNYLLTPEPTNQHDAEAVCLKDTSGNIVGYVSTSKNTMAPGTIPAKTLFKKLTNNKNLDEAWVNLTEATTVKTSQGEDMEAFVGSCSFIPVVEEQKNDSMPVIVGGSLVTCALKAETILAIEEAEKKGLPMPSFLIKKRESNNQSIFYIVENEDEDENLSRGEVLKPSAALSHLIGDGSIRLDVKGICDSNGDSITEKLADKKKCYCGVVNATKQGSTKLMEAMKDVVRQGRSLFSTVEEKVAFMTNEGVPEKIQMAVLQAIQPADPNWEHLVPKPNQVFRQNDSYGELSRTLAYRCKGMNVRLVGNKGSGKNTLAETVDWILNRPQYRLQGNAEMDKMDLLGSQTMKNGTLMFQLSDMICCLMAGGDVVLDEGNTIRPEVAELLHSLTDESREIQVPGYGLVKRHKNSSLTLTMNEGYMGTSRMNEATVDRFVPIQMAQPISIVDVLEEAVPDADDKDIAVCDTIYQMIKNKISGEEYGQGSLEPDAMTIRGFIDALRAADLIGLKAALLDAVGDKPQDEYSRSELHEVILAQCSNY